MESFYEDILKSTGADSLLEKELVQELWSGYGSIQRLELVGSSWSSVIAKHIQLPDSVNHPRGWHSDNSHRRKAKSYEVEKCWYQEYSKYCVDSCKVAKPLLILGHQNEHLILLEDLDQSGYPLRKGRLGFQEVKNVLDWLASFHAIFMNRKAVGLWQTGSYWHLETRPDEFEVMSDSPLKRQALKIDKILNSAKYKTIIHGDAKVANFCFSNETNRVAAVDFQYVGGGCGMKDVSYFLGSCLSNEELKLWEDELLKHYFLRLKEVLISLGSKLLFEEIESEWRYLYPFAWADFERFLLGWMPQHKKLTPHSQSKVDETLRLLKDC